jgi:membrane protein DedA with SNARE-associated domain
VRVPAAFGESLTYIGLFLTLLAAGLGVPIPEEIPIVTAGVLSHAAVVRWWGALPICLVGVLSGDVVLHWAGRHWGERITEWRPVRWILSPAREARLKAGYRQHATKIIFVARHVMGLRAAAFITAGIAGVPFWRFLLADGLAALARVPLAFGLAFVFADRVHTVLADVRRVERWLALAALAAAAAWLAVLAWRGSRRLDADDDDRV